MYQLKEGKSRDRERQDLSGQSSQEKSLKGEAALDTQKAVGSEKNQNKDSGRKPRPASQLVKDQGGWFSLSNGHWST